MKKILPDSNKQDVSNNTDGAAAVGALQDANSSSTSQRLSSFAFPSTPQVPSSPSSNNVEVAHLEAPYVINNGTPSPTPSARAAAPTVGERQQRRLKPGILRLDMHKPRRSSGGSVEFRSQPQMLGEDVTLPTGATSPHQLSVTWATNCDFNEAGLKFKPMLSNSEEASLPTVTEKERRSTLTDEKLNELSAGLDSPVHGIIDYQPHQRQSDEDNYNHNDEDEDDDYSISVSAIMQRRASVRGYRNKRGSRSSRRTSSPMDHVLDNAERRRSSVYTTSSDEGTNQESTQEQIFENIRLHKEVIQSVKLQPWHIRKKLKLVRQAKTYVARHEGALQERFAMSRSTRDLWARFKILMAARWRHWKRETASFLTVLIPWELRIKEIESHFGSGVASYFTFLRWLMWVNIMIAIPLVAFVIGPEYFATKHDETDPRKKMTDHEFNVAGNLFTIWEFEGYLKYSPMFYGYYSSLSGASSLGYKLPLAYFLTAVVVYIYSFVATLRKMAENSRNSKLSSKDDECTFSWKIFTGWDFMIGHAETAHNRIASVVVGFKEALLEEAEKKKDNRNWRIILQRILVNILVMGLLAASGYTVVALVNNAENLALQDNWLSRNAVNVTMTLLSFFLPMIFEALGLFENWHPRQQLRLQLARIMILNMLNLYSLMFSFIYKINSKEKPLQKLKISNDTATLEYAQLTAIIESIKTATTTLGYQDMYSTASNDISTTSSDSSSSDTSTTEFLLGTTASAIYSTVSRMKCYNITIKCSKPTRIGQRSLATTTTALLLLNLTTTMLPSTTIEPTTNEPATTLWTTGEPSTMETTTATTAAKTEPTTAYNLLTTYAATTRAPTTTTDLTTTTSLSTTTEDFKTTDFENDDYTTSSSDVDSTTIWQSSTTTTASPGNDSFFDYYDYFVGLPIDMESSEDLATDNDADNDGEQGKNTKDPLQQPVRRARAAGDELSADGAGPVQKPPRKSKYSRRKSDSQLVLKESNDNEEDDNESTSTTGTRSTSMTTLLTTNPPTTTTTRTTMTTIATTDDTSAATTLPTTTTVTDSSQKQTILWQRNENLRNVVAYFTTTTTTNEPPPATMITKAAIPSTTKTSTITTSTTTTTTPSTTFKTESVDERTPYFISDDDIADIGETMFVDANELDDDNMENCTRMICEPADMFTSTTEMDATTLFNTELPTPLLTPLELHQKRLAEVKQTLKIVQRNLTSMCWETSLGQELSKVIVFDGIMSIVAPLCIDFLRALFVRYVNQNWCWDMEKTFPQYGDFKIAENILTLINNQGQVWMGIFFSPGLVIINLVKLMIMMYFRSWIVLTCNVPHEVVFKASKSNNFYLSLLLTMLFLCVLPVGYAIVWLRPSWHCGPFSDYNRISEFITNTTRNALPKQLHEPLDYMTSSSTVIPLLLLLILIIYYLVSLTGALREANQDLRTQLQKEREEERKKIFKVPEIKPVEPTATTLTNRWRKVLEASSPVTPTQAPDFETDEYKNQARKELISRIMKKALRKGSATSEDESVVIRQGRDDDDTDTEHHDSLPHDEEAKDKRFGLSKLQQIRRTRKPSLVDIVHIAKTERERAAANAAAAAVGMPAAKEIHPRGRFKIERHEKKDEGTRKTPPATSPVSAPVITTDHDPDVNSRIVSERRASLLNRKKPEEAVDVKKVLEQKPLAGKKQTKNTADTKPALHKMLPTAAANNDSKFAVVDEKKPQPPPSEHSTEFKFKLRRPKLKESKPNSSTEPEVFKFDEKAVERSQKKQLGRRVDIPMVPSTPHSSAESPTTAKSRGDMSPTTPTSISSLKHQNAEKLANLSRQGRKKIGSLLALVREAVNTKKSDSDSPPSEEAESNATAIQMPPTPEPQTVKTQMAPLNIKLATAAKNMEAPPPTPKLAPLEDPEELDQHGPITFPMRGASQRRKPQVERTNTPLRQDSQTSIWSDNIPTITISHTGSDECIVEPETESKPEPATPTTPGSVVNIIKIQIEDEKQAKT